eukprot:6189923-Pleurochrysis_carterae.AAC.1
MLVRAHACTRARKLACTLHAHACNTLARAIAFPVLCHAVAGASTRALALARTRVSWFTLTNGHTPTCCPHAAHLHVPVQASARSRPYRCRCGRARTSAKTRRAGRACAHAQPCMQHTRLAALAVPAGAVRVPNCGRFGSDWNEHAQHLQGHP